MMQRLAIFAVLSVVLTAVFAEAVLSGPPGTTPTAIELQPAAQPPPSINISFIKEVTLTVSPPDLALTPREEQDASSFLEAGLRLLDPIMRFFETLTTGSPAPSSGQDPA